MGTETTAGRNCFHFVHILCKKNNPLDGDGNYNSIPFFFNNANNIVKKIIPLMGTETRPNSWDIAWHF